MILRARSIACLGATLLLASACNQPAVSLKPPAFQDSENTVRDWQSIGHTITTGMAARGLIPSAPMQPQSASPAVTRPVHVRVESPESPFLKEVANQIEADVLQRGGTTARPPAAATVVNLGVDFVRWSPRDKPAVPPGTEAAAALITGTEPAAAAPYSRWGLARTIG